jgi:hypothetical protein
MPVSKSTASVQGTALGANHQVGEAKTGVGKYAFFVKQHYTPSRRKDPTDNRGAISGFLAEFPF